MTPLVVVARDRHDVVTRLASRFGQHAVVIDRRFGEHRRAVTARPHLERRGGRERRREVKEPDDLLWREAGYRVVPCPDAQRSD